MTQVSDLEREVCEGNVTISGLRAELAHTQEELRAASDARDAAKVCVDLCSVCVLCEVCAGRGGGRCGREVGF